MPPTQVSYSVLSRHHKSALLTSNYQIITEGRIKEIPEWFPGARLNYAENILRFDGDSIACTAIRESGVTVHYSFRQLKSMVRDMAAALRVNGLQVGDRVAGKTSSPSSHHHASLSRYHSCCNELD